ncbi:zinc finger protein [Schizosaccharomyces japonicus yFS275]|uniref:E3 ubiquitin-protein ligase PEP5 n=1 Tax=Schizosaccharomyces japonicus (strain yFS275 / FY16936) TaxID=402676 RepID=B6K886_SCHJY|nr:zinc finger protein [Schizosaccharomyces japonicus yFS275]EEB09740.1 zinc finger protein [Schizosaccharomyces japonicus yFS275]
MTLHVSNWKRLSLYHKRDRTRCFNRSFTCVSSRESYIVAGYSDGSIHILKDTFENFQTLELPLKVTVQQIIWLSADSFVTLSSVPDHDSESNVIIYCYKLIREPATDSSRDEFVLVNEHIIAVREPPYPITAFDLSLDARTLICGFASGLVISIKGDFLRDRSLRLSVLHQLKEPVTNVKFDIQEPNLLYVATTGKLITISGKVVSVLDHLGVAMNCMDKFNTPLTRDSVSYSLVCARSETVSFIRANTLDSFLLFYGEKHYACVNGDILAIVFTPSAKSNSKGTVVPGIGYDKKSETLCRIMLLDIKQQLIVWEDIVPTHVAHVLSRGSKTFILTVDGYVQELEALSLQKELKLLTKRSMFDIALELAEQHRIPLEERRKLVLQYADYLFRQGSFSEAVKYYISEIQSCRATEICRKFLEVNEIGNLVRFLEALNFHLLASQDHLMLLLSSYIKLKRYSSIEHLLDKGGFNIMSAYDICYKSGLYEQALRLAKANGLHERVIDLLVEEGKYLMAIEYLKQMEPDVLESLLLISGHSLISNLPKETTELFISYYTGTYYPIRKEQKDTNLKQTKSAPYFLSLMPYSNPLVSLDGVIPEQSTHEDGVTKTPESAKTSLAELPNPQNCFHIFVQHIDCFIVFLESLLTKTNTEHQTFIATSLFEAYVRKSRNDISAEGAIYEKKANALLSESEVHLDLNRVFLISQILDFDEGVRYVQGKTGQMLDMFRSYCQKNDVNRALAMLRTHGNEVQELYTIMLNYFCTDGNVDGWEKEFQKVLQFVITNRLVSTPQLVDILSRSSSLTFGDIKQALRNMLRFFESAIGANGRQIEGKNRRIHAISEQLQILKSSAFVVQETVCSACGSELEPPVVHFRCHHSYHMRCIEDECPHCKWSSQL